MREDGAEQDFRDKLAARPGHPPAAMGLATILIGQARVADLLTLARELAPANRALAEGILVRASKALPDEFSLAEAFCSLAEEYGQPVDAIMRWSRIRRRLSQRIEAHLGYIGAVMRQSRLAEAEVAVQYALMMFGRKAPVLRAQAELAEAQSHWSEAARLWADIAQSFPDEEDAAARGQQAADRAALTPAPSAPGTAVNAPAAFETNEVKQLVKGFESLGHNCEFGLLQRHFGAEPLGLLRFSVAPPAALLSLLISRFEGVGDPAGMTLTLDHGEYMMRHTRSNWAMHTRRRPGPGVDEAKLFHDQCRNAQFLARKLIKDLQAQSKIFVYWRPDLTDQAIANIYKALQIYGPNMLVCVRLFDAAHPPGSVEWRDERLMVGYLDRPGNAFRGASWSISFAHWVSICEAAQMRRRALAPDAQTAAA